MYVMKAARGHHEGADGEGHIVRPCAILAPVTAVRDDRAALIEIAAIITIRAEIESDVNVPSFEAGAIAVMEKDSAALPIPHRRLMMTGCG